MTGRTYCLPGSAWATSELAWEQGFAALSSFVHDYGEASVPASFKTPDGFNLGTWVAAQRREKDSMPEARKSRLEALEGWMWSADEFRWESGFAALECYVVEHGDARVPVGFTAPNPRLTSTSRYFLAVLSYKQRTIYPAWIKGRVFYVK